MSTSTVTASDKFTLRQSKYRGLVPTLNTMNTLVVGCGSLGSHLIAMLSRMGADYICAVDMDRVSEENLGVQDFMSEDLGRGKAEALALRYGRGRTAILPVTLRFKDYAKNLLESHITYFTHVFICVDNMETRTEIFDALTRRSYPNILVDGRLDANIGWIYTCSDAMSSKWYRGTLYPDSEVIKTANRCAIQMTGYSAHVVAGLMVAQAMRFSQDPTLEAEKCGIDLNNMLFFPI